MSREHVIRKKRQVVELGHGVRAQRVSCGQMDTLERKSSQAYELREADSEIKQAQREIVADWILSRTPGAVPLRLLTLPDLHWSFENYLYDRCKRDVSFCGVQRDWRTLVDSLVWMPPYGGECFHSPFETSIGTVEAFVNHESAVVYMWVGDLCSVVRRDMNDGKWLQWRRLCRSNTAIWLDFTSPICTDVGKAMRRLWVYARRDVEVPVVISVLAARDAFKNDKERASAISGWLQPQRFPGTTETRSWAMHKTVKHQSAKSPFLTVLGSFSPMRDCRDFLSATSPPAVSAEGDVATIRCSPT